MSLCPCSSPLIQKLFKNLWHDSSVDAGSGNDNLSTPDNPYRNFRTILMKPDSLRHRDGISERFSSHTCIVKGFHPTRWLSAYFIGVRWKPHHSKLNQTKLPVKHRQHPCFHFQCPRVIFLPGHCRPRSFELDGYLLLPVVFHSICMKLSFW